jgi:adenine-specific DNA-methyltransferase
VTTAAQFQEHTTEVPVPVRDRAHRSALGQFFTPVSVAKFMAARLSLSGEIRLLDAGAGIGSLTAAALARTNACTRVEAECWEIDTQLLDPLRNTLKSFKAHQAYSHHIHADDFIEHAVELIERGEKGHYTHAILNPPYKKITSASDYRQTLRRVGIETVNLYSAFVALSLALLREGGELVAIIPRSFANGPYYKSFREFIFRHAKIESIHLFAARDQVFGGDEVLQENIIIKLVKGGTQGDVSISTSEDATFSNLSSALYPFSSIVLPDDAEHFLRIPEHGEPMLLDQRQFNHSLAQLRLEVRTGPVVDFRLKTHLLATPAPDGAPLIYMSHFDGGFQWPRGGKKPDAIQRHSEVDRWLMPNECYVVTRRFTSKEERRRVVAHVFPAATVPGEAVGFENHLNVFHFRKRGLDETLAFGLSAYLNSTAVDQYFRRFSGHTQVNATDLRSLRYPSRDALMRLGAWARAHRAATQEEMDFEMMALA